MHNRYLLSIIVVILITLMIVASTDNSISPVKASLPNSVITDTVTLEDFDDILTKLDLGFNDFGGNMGAINDEYLAETFLFCDTPQDCALRPHPKPGFIPVPVSLDMAYRVLHRTIDLFHPSTFGDGAIQGNRNLTVLW